MEDVAQFRSLARTWIPDRSENRSAKAKGGSSQILQKWKEALFHNIEDSSKKKGQGEEYKKLVRQFSAVVLCDELPAQLDGARHGLKFLICIQNSS